MFGRLETGRRPPASSCPRRVSCQQLLPGNQVDTIVKRYWLQISFSTFDLLSFTAILFIVKTDLRVARRHCLSINRLLAFLGSGTAFLGSPTASLVSETSLLVLQLIFSDLQTPALVSEQLLLAFRPFYLILYHHPGSWTSTLVPQPQSWFLIQLSRFWKHFSMALRNVLDAIALKKIRRKD